MTPQNEVATSDAQLNRQNVTSQPRPVRDLLDLNIAPREPFYQSFHLHPYQLAKPFQTEKRSRIVEEMRATIRQKIEEAKEVKRREEEMRSNGMAFAPERVNPEDICAPELITDFGPSGVFEVCAPMRNPLSDDNDSVKPFAGHGRFAINKKMVSRVNREMTLLANIRFPELCEKFGANSSIVRTESQYRRADAAQLERQLGHIKAMRALPGSHGVDLSPQQRDEHHAALLNIANINKHYRHALGMSTAQKMCGFAAGTRNDCDKTQRQRLLSTWKNEAIKEACDYKSAKSGNHVVLTEGLVDRLNLQESMPTLTLADLNLTSLIQKHFPYTNLDTPLNAVTATISRSEIPALLDNMRANPKSYYIVHLSGAKNGEYDRNFVFTQQSNHSNQWCMLTAADQPIEPNDVTDPLSYLLNGYLQKSGASILLLSPQFPGGDLQRMNANLQHLGYTFDDVSAENYDLFGVLEENGCKVSHLEIDVSDPNDLDMLTPDSDGATVLTVIDTANKNHATMLWSQANQAMGRDLHTGEIFSGSPLDFLNQNIIEAGVSAKKIIRTIVKPSSVAFELSWLTGMSKEDAQCAWSNYIKNLGLFASPDDLLTLGDIRDFLHSIQQDTVVEYDYDPENISAEEDNRLAQLLDHAPHNILMTYTPTEEEEPTNIFFPKPGEQQRNEIIGYQIEDDDISTVMLSPSELLNQLKDDGYAVSILSNGPLAFKPS